MVDSRLRHSSYLPSSNGAPSGIDSPTMPGVVASVLQTGFQSTKQEYSNVLDGRMSLAALEGIVLGMVVFYIWTRGVQGGG